MQSLPDVIASTAASVLPRSGSLWTQPVAVEDYTFHPGEDDGAALNAAPTDPAAYLPALAAARVDPLAALRRD